MPLQQRPVQVGHSLWVVELHRKDGGVLLAFEGPDDVEGLFRILRRVVDAAGEPEAVAHDFRSAQHRVRRDLGVGI